MNIETVKEADGLHFTIKAPLWWWRETYALTMSHGNNGKVHPKYFRIEDFDFPKECRDLKLFDGTNCDDIGWLYNDIMTYCQECYSKAYETNDNRYLIALGAILPECYLYTDTLILNSINMRTIYQIKHTDTRFEWIAFCHILQGELNG